MAHEARIAEIESALAATAAEIEGLKQAVRDAKESGRVSPLALWAPALATTIAISGLAVFVLDERIGPILGDVRQAQRDIRDLSAVTGEVKRENVAQDERLHFMKDWVDALQVAVSKNREKIHEVEKRK